MTAADSRRVKSGRADRQGAGAEMSATADQELAELRRAYEKLQNEHDTALAELQVRTASLAQRNNEYGERIKHQSATIDVLKAMSHSPGDPQPVFDLITKHAAEHCNSRAVLWEFDGTLMHFRASHGAGYDLTAQEAIISQFPAPPNRGVVSGRAILEQRLIHISDATEDAEIWPLLIANSARSYAAIPLMRAGKPIGAISMNSPIAGGFSDSQVALLQTFAEQAVIAITSAETYRALQARTTDLQQSLEYQTATSNVLKVISRSVFDLQPVLRTVARDRGAALRCRAGCHPSSRRGCLALGRQRRVLHRNTRHILKAMGPVMTRSCVTNCCTQNSNRRAPWCIFAMWPPFKVIQRPRQTGQAADLTWCAACCAAGETIGLIQLSRQRVEPFTERQIELVSTFADQAVIAIENTRLLTEQREALEQQTATAEVLQVINSSPGDLGPVFEAIGEKAIKLCDAAFGGVMLPSGDRFKAAALGSVPEAYAEFCRSSPDFGWPVPGSLPARLLAGAEVVQIPDVADETLYPAVPSTRALVELGGARTLLGVALRKDGEFIGMFTIYRQEVRPFSDRQVTLLRGFAAQAVIAIENARLLSQIRQRQEELRITFENMGDGVAMFDEMQHLVAWNSKFQEIYDLPETLLQQRQTYKEYLRFLAERGDFGAGIDPAEQIAELVATTDQPYGYERTRPDGRVIEIRRNPVPDGGFVLIFSDITERKRSEVEIRAARDAAEAAYRDLKAAQASLIQAEKMASLGQLTAGIAHEIKNPLNFVNNFAELSGDMLDELNEALANNRQAEVDELTGTLKGNLAKIAEHGRRADGIVRGMLEHSRGSSGEQREVELNALVDEALNLAYHGARAQDQSFAVTLQREFGEGIAPITLAPQDVTRVLLNLFSNGFYAARERQRTEAVPGFEPTLKVSTRDLDDAVEIRVRDNGIGIPARDQGQTVPAVLHHEAAGGGDWSWPVDELRHHHTAARRQHQRRQQSGRIQRIHCAAAAPLMTGCPGQAPSAGFTDPQSHRSAAAWAAASSRRSSARIPAPAHCP